MNDPLLVRRFQRFGDLTGDGDGVGDRERGRQLIQGMALDQLHDERRLARRLLYAMDVRDVGMIERRQDVRLALEPGTALGIAMKGVGKDLDRDVAMQPGVACAIDLTHSAFAQLGEDPVRTDILADQWVLARWATARPRRSSRSEIARTEAGPPAPSEPVISYCPRRAPVLSGICCRDAGL